MIIEKQIVQFIKHKGNQGKYPILYNTYYKDNLLRTHIWYYAPCFQKKSYSLRYNNSHCMFKHIELPSHYLPLLNQSLHTIT